MTDYPFQKLIQYLKFGFPLLIVNPDSITNHTVANYFCALQHPNQVTEYLTKEKAKGAILGPVDVITTEQYHCFPLLTQPKDSDKKKVILNLSYPYGASLNDAVDKTHFDGMKFNLKFPSVDDIDAQILAIESDIYLSKIDVARASGTCRLIQWMTLSLISQGRAAIMWTGLSCLAGFMGPQLFR